MTGPSVISTPAAKFHVPCPIRVVQYQVRARTSSQPATRSQRMDCRGTSTGRTCTSISVTALNANVAASRTNAQPAPAVKMSNPASAGPVSRVALAAMPISEFACWRASPSTVPATSGVVAGRPNAEAAPPIAAAAAICASWMCPASSSRPMNSWTAPRTTSATSATRRGCSRSTITPPSGSRASRGSIVLASTTASAPAEPVACTIARVSAAGVTESPSSSTTRPTKSSRKLRSLSGCVISERLLRYRKVRQRKVSWRRIWHTGLMQQDSVDRHIEHWITEIPDLDPLVEGITTRMHLLLKHLKQQRHATIAARELEDHEYDTLHMLGGCGPDHLATPTEIAAWLHMSPAASRERRKRGSCPRSTTTSSGNCRRYCARCCWSSTGPSCWRRRRTWCAADRRAALRAAERAFGFGRHVERRTVHRPLDAFEHVLADEVGYRDRVLAVEAGPAQPRPGLVGGGDQAVQRDIAQRVGTERGAD